MSGSPRASPMYDDTTTASWAEPHCGGDALVQSSEVKSGVAGTKLYLIPCPFHRREHRRGRRHGRHRRSAHRTYKAPPLRRSSIKRRSRLRPIEQSAASGPENGKDRLPVSRRPRPSPLMMEINDCTATISPACHRARNRQRHRRCQYQRSTRRHCQLWDQPTGNPANPPTGSTTFAGSVAVAIGLYTNTATSFIDAEPTSTRGRVYP